MIFAYIPTFTAFFAANGGDYSYIKPGGVAFNITAILIGLLLGGLLACILTVFFHASVGKIFRTLMSHRAFTRESAKTFREMELPLRYPVKRALRSRHSLLRKLLTVVLPDGTVIPPIHSLDDDLAKKEADASFIHAEEYPILRAEEGENTENGGQVSKDNALPTDPHHQPNVPSDIPFDPETACYFLDDVHRRRAEIRFAGGHGNEIRFLVPVFLVFAVLAATLPIYLPYFVELLDTVIGQILGGS